MVVVIVWKLPVFAATSGHSEQHTILWHSKCYFIQL